jgi:O-antigen/teichoic acid export membrane protein
MHASLPRAVKQNLYYALGIVIMKGVSFFMLPFIAHHLTPEAFGLLEILNTLGALGSILVGFGLVHALFRFTDPEQSESESRHTAAEIFGLNLSISIVILVAGLLLADPLSGWLPAEIDSYAVRLMVIMVALEGCLAIPLGWLRLRERAALFFILNTGKALLQTGLVLLFLTHGRGIDGILEAGLISAALLGAALVTLQYRDSGIRLPTQRLHTLLIYSMPLVGSGLLGFILTGLDRWILADAVGAAELARYALAAKFALLAALMLQPFLMWWTPRRLRVLHEHEGHLKAAQFAAMGSTFSLLIVVSIGLTAPLAISTLFPTEYGDAARYVPWLVLLMAVKDSAELLNLGCFTGHTTRAQLWVNLAGSLSGLIGLLILIPVWGSWGAIAALFIAQGMRLLLYTVVSQQILPLPYPTRNLLRMAALTLCLLLLGEWVDGWLGQTLLALLGMLLMLLSAYAMKLLPGSILRVAA